MRVVLDLSELHEPLRKSAVTIGNFDGIHLGHRELLRRVVHSARDIGGTSVVVTFDPHPAQVLAPEHAPKTITPLALKTRLIEREGIDLLIVLRFTRELSLLSPAEFAGSILVEKLRAVSVHVGSNFRFGYQRAGDTSLLADLGRKSGFQVETLAMIKVRGYRVSSSHIRQFLSEGRVQTAGRMLGRPYGVSGPITPGEGVGHKETVPTLNLGPVEQQLPKIGVYITRTCVGGTVYDSVTNVGHKPTFGHHRLTVESFLLDFRGEIDAEEMDVEFLHRLRDEIKFPNAEALKRQIGQDIQRSVKFFRLAKRLSGTWSRPSHSTPAGT
ncbi:MAG: bifunctional riboflavin kinase/FAD synthetase [Acidobacteria bacterium]|nr:MAG: bifunctional riboflavin kinase/FAD synthetase [Acidobacteriota bacterium]